ncbi:MAG: metallophosphoesterase [Anaerolineae bacterium]|nr:metallophosphoesterase [Anaerolineae bacterium]
MRKLNTSLIIGGAGAVAGFGAALLAYARYIEPFRWDVNQFTLRIPRLDPAFDGYRIAHLSDFHIDSVTTPERLYEVVAIANDWKPDLYALTGDFVTAGKHFDASALSALFAAMRAPDGKVAVLGNHDRRGHLQAVRKALASGGVTELQNVVVTLNRGDARLHIGGVDSFYRRKARLDLVLEQLPHEGTALLLAHEPDFADIAAPTKRFALQLSGHAHGGQVRIPYLTRFGLPMYGERYIAGLKLVGDMLLYVNRGLGMTSAPIRFNCPPEIALITLRV